MHASAERTPLGPGFDPATVFSALFGAGDGFWLDSGPDGMSYLGTGPALAFDGPVLPRLREEAGDAGVALVGWLGYELRAETAGQTAGRRSRYPDAAFLRADRVVAIDNRTGQAELLGPDAGGDWTARLEAIRGMVAAEPPVPGPASAAWDAPDDVYLDRIRACQSAIRDGDAYQLCLTNEASIDGRFDPLTVYLALRRLSATRYGGLLRIGGISLVSSSPETFLTVSADGLVRTRPVKGTRSRAADADEDVRLRSELLASDKERAENLMIVDLMRNDLSRICELGSVAVTGLLEVESLPTVHQLVSTIEGRLAPGRTAVDAVTACFPAGSMTGAPRLRAMELLDAIEGRPRGLYAGAFGYLSSDGGAELAMTIRSIVLDDRGATIGAGGAITSLSVPEEELAEVKLKAAALLTALGTPGETAGLTTLDG